MSNSSFISDQRFSASSSLSGHSPSDGRLKGSNAWIPATNNDNNDFLQIDLGSLYFVCGVATQGNPNNDHWTKTYKIKTSLDNVVWTVYSEGGSERYILFRPRGSNSEIIIVETLSNKGLCLPLSLEKQGFHMPKLLSFLSVPSIRFPLSSPISTVSICLLLFFLPPALLSFSPHCYNLPSYVSCCLHRKRELGK